MPKQIDQLFVELKADLDRLEADLSPYSLAELNAIPADGGWSALQCLQHLRMAERQSQAYVEKKLSFNPSLPKTDMGHAVRRFLLKNYMNIPIKIQAPKGLGTEQLPEESDLATLLEEWRSQRRSLQAYLSGLEQDIFTRQVFKHPLAGRVSLEAMLQFFRAHFGRHRRQAFRALGEQKPS